MLLANHIFDPKIERLLQGARGERAVGAEIEILSPDGWHVLHNISLGRGDVDHVLIGPGGIYTIETKSHRGRIRIDRIERRMLQQAYAEKQLLERIIGYKVEPLLVFSQAGSSGTCQPSGRASPSCPRECWSASARGKGPLFLPGVRLRSMDISSGR